jgi:hypothetical protein
VAEVVVLNRVADRNGRLLRIWMRFAGARAGEGAIDVADYRRHGIGRHRIAADMRGDNLGREGKNV